MIKICYQIINIIIVWHLLTATRHQLKMKGECKMQLTPEIKFNWGCKGLFKYLKVDRDMRQP